MLLFSILPMSLLASARDESERAVRRACLERMFGGRLPTTPFEVRTGPRCPSPSFSTFPVYGEFFIRLRHPDQMDSCGSLQVHLASQEEISGAQCEDLAERMEARAGRPLTRWVVYHSMVDSDLRKMTIGAQMYRAAVAEAGRRGGLLLPHACHDLGSTSGMAEAAWQRLYADPTLWIEAGTLRRSRPGHRWPIAAFDPLAAGLIPAAG